VFILFIGGKRLPSPVVRENREKGLLMFLKIMNLPVQAFDFSWPLTA
jgi:hypothetical protein